MRSVVLSLTLALSSLSAVADEDVLEEVIVTATLRQQALVDVPASITVLDERTLRDAGRQHFEDVLSGVPNLHWAGGTSRPRYFQIRGVGEREQYVGAPNPSIGFLIDDIDFSGIGMPATLFDVERIEVLRGAQGLRYGANALAGLIVMRGQEPSDQFNVATEASVGEYDSESAGLAATGPVESLNSAWRVAVQRYRSDGFRDDSYLRRDDTNDRDELTARAKWRWRPSEDTQVDLTWLHADLDNGYDGWSIDNSRRSLADRPGKDAQKSDGASLRVQTDAGSIGRLSVVASASDSDIDYSFDEDWGNAQSWAPYTYDYFYRSLRNRKARSIEARLTSDAAQSAGDIAWLAGVYALDVDERVDESRVGVYVDPFEPDFSGSTNDLLHSQYDATNVAVFGQLEGWLTQRWGWSFGLRGEQRSADYRERGFMTGATRATVAEEDERMWGGQATLHFDPQDHLRLFATLSRGYKAGGFNLGRGALIRPRFAPEYLLSLDVGAKGEWLDGRLYADVTAFYMKRDDMQVSTGVQIDALSGYFFITDNASTGKNLGVESSVRWRVGEQWEIGGTLGLLRTQYSGYRRTVADLSDRDQAYAPEYQVSVNATWRHPLGWMARVDVSAVDDYYFDVPSDDPRENNHRADASALTHVKAGYEADRWSVYAWARNVFDEDYVIRGFYFANEPPFLESKRYTQLGEPRQFGITARWEFR